jgi:2-oxoacid:acceptor oxidoreductase delta subunit (pyruvate/2-ketoisovalerate family)
VPLEGSNFDIDADMVVTAIGEQPDLRFLPSDLKAENWGVLVDGHGRTNIPGIYAGGDMANGEGTVTHAVGRGRQAALAIDAFLQGKEPPPCEEVERYLKDRSHHQVAWQEMNPAYFNLAERIEPKGVAIPARVRNFEEIYSGLSEEIALQEAHRCFSCGVCPECDNCLVFCPDAAISRKEGGRYEINYDYCKGCGICVSECPRNAISIKVLK